MTEARLQQQVIDLARWAGFMYFHDNDPRRNRRGFLDLVMVHLRTGRLIFTELKSDKGRLRPEQKVWIDALRLGGAEVYLWTPADWHSGEIRDVLTRDRGRAAA